MVTANDAHAPIPELPTDPAALREHPYAALLPTVQKPGRYLGGEEQQIVKDHDTLRCRFVLAFPDLYEVGMSHLGTRILYDLVNKHDDLVCERAFSPWRDLEQGLRDNALPLVSLETYTPLSAFDVVGVSLQYELSYSNVLLNLELGGIPLRSADRSDTDPIVLAGGPTATHPEPLTPFVDALLVGEAEELLPTLLRTIGDLRAAGRPRSEQLAACAQLPGIYVPAFYRVELDPRTGLQVVVGRTPQGEAAGAPERVSRVWVRDLEDFPFPQRFPVPYAEAIFDRAAVEITRGCTEGCRFCQAGIIYRPVRERSPKAVIDAVLGGADAAGFSETSLTALSTADVSCIDPLIKALVPELVKRKTKLGVASLRAYGLSGELLDEVKRVGINGLTFAPEAGTPRMRQVINKNVSEQDILDSATRIFERGYDRMKLYFIMGLPTETEADVAGIVQTGERVLAQAKSMGLPRPPQVTVSVSQHVPKPHTPFQWAAMDSMEDLHTKVQLLREMTRRTKVGLKTHEVRESWLECLFARGDRKMGEALEHAYLAGARFDGWREYFSFERWLDALAAADIDPTVYTRTLPVDARLPWDHIDVGIDDGFLADEYRKALASRSSPPCGKAVGDQVHHRELAVAEADERRLVCYDCGIACDMTQMRSERIDSLRTLSRLQDTQHDPVAEPTTEPPLVPASRLVGRLSPSNLADDSAFKASAEAPHSRLRLVFAKHGPLRFLGHRDLLRILPRMFRRAGLEQAFSRGYNPIPRMSFGPALALGMGAEAEVVDADVLLPCSAEDLGGMLGDAERETVAAEVLEQLRSVAPPGLVLRSARLVGPDELRLGQLVAAADYVVSLTDDEAERLQARMDEALAQPELIVQRSRHKKKPRRGKKRPAGPAISDIDIKQSLMHAEQQDNQLRFRLRLDGQGGARPREVVEALLGERVPDHHMTRERLLVNKDAQLVGIDQVGRCPRPPSLPRVRSETVAAPSPDA
ncbi:MAG: TIGR03960 family B12-binding radical SAM protein [Deltaproteobacteria bacterium]|nr:TIGR03960 family B12-binding radical SAM protein [Deltaproteobacteria bacterium]